MNLKPTTKVGVPYRCPVENAGFAEPHAGTLLASNDPRAWQGTIAFGDRCPTQAEVDRHVARMRELGCDMDATVPVLWHFPSGDRLYWEPAKDVRPYDVIVREWKRTRALERGHLSEVA